MTTTDPFVPTEQKLRDLWSEDMMYTGHPESEAGFDRWLVGIKAEALRDAADVLGGWSAKEQEWLRARADALGVDTP